MTIIATLNSAEEEVVLQRFKKYSRDNCRELLEELVKCTKSHTVSIPMQCRLQNELVQECLKKHSTEAVRDAFREEELHRKREFLKANGKWPTQYDTK
ncbi:hypothetical protein HK105_202091 [Polyrhizophydium stewartii]|uniref:COX assembly mitochondrial protein n=1 Tax=Polyrhizophydium stewartii TaxID=2732419 RepID=A0ABR4NFA6_9FUNG|nr:hypothetical protein HK105_006398 [Polyrhizophydium stewartii]